MSSLIGLEFKEKRRIFLLFLLLFSGFQLVNILGREKISQMAESQLEIMRQQSSVHPLPPLLDITLDRVISGGDVYYFTGQWLIKSFIPFLVLLVLILGATQIKRDMEDRVHYFYLNYRSRSEYLRQKLSVTGLLIAGWIGVSALLSVVLISALGWKIPVSTLLLGYLMVGLRVYLVYLLILLISLLIRRRGLVTLLAILLGILHSAVIQLLPPFGRHSWLSATTIFFYPQAFHWEFLLVTAQSALLYWLVRRRWLSMDL